MKRRTLITIGIAAAVVVAVGGGVAYSASSNRPLVGVATVGTGSLAVSVSASGTVVPAHNVGVYPPTSGTLAHVEVSDGAQVKAGDVLATLDTTPLSLAVAQAKAAYTAALAQRQSVDNAVPSGSERSAANGALSAARAQASTASKNYADYRAAYDKATPDERTAMVAQLRTLKSARTTANAAVSTAKAATSKLNRAAQVGTARTAAAQAISAAKKALRLAQQNLDNAKLTAPFDGIVAFSGTVEPGSGVTAGVAALTIVDPTRMEFQAAVNQTDIAGVQAGQAAQVTLDAFDTPFAGKVLSVQALPRTTSTGGVAFDARISLQAGSSRLFQGMSGSADITVKSLSNVVLVPVESVLTQGSASTVFVMDAEGVVHARTVQVGASNDTAVQVLSGVSSGDQVVTTGAATLHDGQSVRTK